MPLESRSSIAFRVSSLHRLSGSTDFTSQHTLSPAFCFWSTFPNTTLALPILFLVNRRALWKKWKSARGIRIKRVIVQRWTPGKYSVQDFAVLSTTLVQRASYKIKRRTREQRHRPSSYQSFIPKAANEASTSTRQTS